MRFDPRGFLTRAGQWLLRRIHGVPLEPAPSSTPSPTPPFPPLPAGARLETRRFACAAGSRDYTLFVPGGGGGKPRPLLVMLHGCTQTPEDFAVGTGMNALAQEFGVIVAYPAQPDSANPHRCWNWFSPKNQHRDGGEAAILAGLARQVMADEAVDPARVYAAGLSAGGATAAILASAYPDLFAAVGVHSGLPSGAARGVPSAFTAMRRGVTDPPPRAAGRIVPTIVFHGDADETVHPANAAAVLAQAGASGEGAVEQGQVPGGHAFSRARHADSAGRVLWESWTVHGGGHGWSGGDSAGSHTDPHGPDAGRAMLTFFLGHRLETLAPS